MLSNIYKQSDRRPKQEALTVAGLYAVFGVLWILFSDQALVYWVKSPETLTTLQSYKGTAFILLTSGLLFILILNLEARVYRRTIQHADLLVLSGLYQFSLEAFVVTNTQFLIDRASPAFIMYSSYDHAHVNTQDVFEAMGCTLDQANRNKIMTALNSNGHWTGSITRTSSTEAEEKNSEKKQVIYVSARSINLKGEHQYMFTLFDEQKFEAMTAGSSNSNRLVS